MSESSSLKEIFPLKENIKTILRLKPSKYDSESYIEKKVNCYNQIYSEEVLNRKIYDNSILTIVKSFMKGVDVNFMAFGPKDGGKTYTFIGEKFNINAFKKDSKGIALYAITSIFKALKFMKEKNIQYQIGYSLVEIPNNKDIQVSLNESFKGFNSLKDVKLAILKHYKDRKYENSHTIFSVSLVQYRVNKRTDQMMRLESTLNFIDFSHTITDNLLKEMSVNPTANPSQCLQKIVSYCLYLNEIVTKALAGNDRTILLYCTPYSNTKEEIEIMNKMENIFKLFNKIECNVDINCSETSNSTIVKENLAFLKKKLTKFKQPINDKETYRSLNESNNLIKKEVPNEAGAVIRVDLDISDDSGENIEIDSDDSLIDSYLLQNQESINKEDEIILVDDKNKNETAPYIVIPKHLSTKKDANKETSPEKYFINESNNDKLNYLSTGDYLEPIIEENSQEVIKAMQGVDGKLTGNTSFVQPFITKNLTKTEKQTYYTDPIVTEKRYCEPVVTEKIIEESGRKKRIITINTETITITKRKPAFSSKTVHTTNSNTSNILGRTEIPNGIITDPMVSTTDSLSYEPNISNKSFVTKKTVVKKSNSNDTINEKPVRSASLKREKITDSPVSTTSSAKTVTNVVSSPSQKYLSEINSEYETIIKTQKQLPSYYSNTENQIQTESETQTQTYLLPSLIPRKISSVKPTRSNSLKSNASDSKEKKVEKDNKNFIDTIKDKFNYSVKKEKDHSDNKVEKTEEKISTVAVERNPKVMTTTTKTTTTTVKSIPSVHEIEEKAIKSTPSVYKTEEKTVKNIPSLHKTEEKTVKNTSSIYKTEEKIVPSIYKTEEKTIKNIPSIFETEEKIINTNSKNIINETDGIHNETKIKDLTEAIEAKDAEIKDRVETINQYTDTLLSLEKSQILNLNDSVKYENFEKELKQRTEEDSDEKIDELREKLNYLSNLLSENDKHIDYIDENINDEDEDILESSQSKISFLINVLDEKDALVENSNKKVRDIENKSQLMENTVNDYENRINMLKDQLEEKEKLNGVLQSQMTDLSDRINQAQERMEKLYQLQIKQKEKHKIQLEKQSLKYKKIIKKLIEKNRLSITSLPFSEASRNYDISSNLSRDPSDMFSLRSDYTTTDLLNDDDLANLNASYQHENKIYAEVLNHYNKIFRKLKDVLVNNNNTNDPNNLITSPTFSAPESTNENVLRKAEEIAKTEHQCIKNEDNYQMDLVQAAETLNSQVNHWKQYSSDQQRYIEDLQAEQARLMSKIETLSKLQPLKDGDREENKRLIEEANTTFENIKSEIINSIVVDETSGTDNKAFKLSDYKDELNLKTNRNSSIQKSKKVIERSHTSHSRNMYDDEEEKKKDDKINQQNQKINDLRKCCDRQSEMIVNLEFSLMKAQALIASLTQNDENAAAKFKSLTSDSINNNNNPTTTANTTTTSITTANRSSLYKRNKDRVNPLIYNLNHSNGDSTELDESNSQNQPAEDQLYDVCNLNELPVTNADMSTLLSSREFNHQDDIQDDSVDLEKIIPNDCQNHEDLEQRMVLENDIIKMTEPEKDVLSNQEPLASKITKNQRRTLYTYLEKPNRDSQVTLINDPFSTNASPSRQRKNNIYRQSMSSPSSRYSLNTNVSSTSPTVVPHSPAISSSSQNKNSDKKKNPLKNIFYKSSSESLKSDNEKDSLKKHSISKFFTIKKNRSSSSINSNNESIGENSLKSNHSKPLSTQEIRHSMLLNTENKPLPNPITAGRNDEDSDDDDMPIIKLQQNRMNNQTTLVNKISSTTSTSNYASPYSSPNANQYYDVKYANNSESEIIQPITPTTKATNISQTLSERNNYLNIDDEILNEKKREEFENIPQGQVITENRPIVLNNFTTSNDKVNPYNLNNMMFSRSYENIAKIPNVKETMTTTNEVIAFPITNTYYNKQLNTTTLNGGKTITTTESYKPSANKTVKRIITTTTTNNINTTPKMSTARYSTTYTKKFPESTTTTYKTTTFSPKITETKYDTTNTYKSLDKTQYDPENSSPTVTATYFTTEKTKYESDQSPIYKLSSEYIHQLDQTDSFSDKSNNSIERNYSSLYSDVASSTESDIYAKQILTNDSEYYNNKTENKNIEDIDEIHSIDKYNEIDDDLENVANTTMKSIEKYEFLKRSNLKRNAKLYNNNSNSDEALKQMNNLSELDKSLQDLKEKNKIEIANLSKKPVSNEYEYITTTTNTTTTNTKTKKEKFDNCGKRVKKKFSLFALCKSNNNDDVYTKTNKTNLKKKSSVDFLKRRNDLVTIKKNNGSHVVTNNKNNKVLVTNNKKNNTLVTNNKKNNVLVTNNQKNKGKMPADDEYYYTTTTTTTTNKQNKGKMAADDEYLYTTTTNRQNKGKMTANDEYNYTSSSSSINQQNKGKIVVTDDNYYSSSSSSSTNNKQNKSKVSSDDDYYYTTTTTTTQYDNGPIITTEKSKNYLMNAGREPKHYYEYNTNIKENKTDESKINSKSKKRISGFFDYNYFDI